MYVVVAGCGVVGSQLAVSLSTAGHNVVVLDKDPAAFHNLGATFNGLTLRGFAFDQDLLLDAGIERADAFVAATNLDNANIMSAGVARVVFKVPQVIVRLTSPTRVRTCQQLGLDYVCGTMLVAEWLLDKVYSGRGHHLVGLKDVELVEFRIGVTGAGQTVGEVESAGVFRVSAVTRDGVSFLPTSATILQQGDMLWGAVLQASYSRTERMLGAD